jgi:ectoine hydroxylase-related dioxygenase (phytanoyl-CoA dioxygenase family)
MLNEKRVEVDDGRAVWSRNLPWIDKDVADIDRFIETYRYANVSLYENLISWRKNGFVVLEQAVPHRLVNLYIDELDHLRTHLHEYLIPLELHGVQTWSRAIRPDLLDHPSVKFNHLHLASFHAARLSLAKPIMDFLRAIFLAPPVPMQSLTFLKGSQQRTHIDYPYVKQQRRLPFMAASWIALEDIHPDSGPLAYFPGAHKIEVSGFFDWGNGSIIPSAEGIRKSGNEFSDFLETRLANLSYDPRVFLPKKGDVFIWHANLPHLGTPVADPSRTRKSYVTHYTGLFDFPIRWLPSPKDDMNCGVSSDGGNIFELPWDRQKMNTKLPSWAGKPDASVELIHAMRLLNEGEDSYVKSCFGPRSENASCGSD